MEFDAESVVNSYRWFGHRDAWTEINAFHPLYRPGRQHREYNRKYRTFPVVQYVKNEKQLLKAVSKFHGSHLVCYGINPRSSVKTYPSGHPRAHRDSEIEVVKSFYFDFDLNDSAEKEDIASLELFLEEVIGKVDRLGLSSPIKAFTGNGFHLLFAIPDIAVNEYSDLKERIRSFREHILKGFESKLESLSTKVDSTDDLSRLAKVYGTAKPGKKVLSRFYNDGWRVEDKHLKEHLMNMELSGYKSKKNIGLGETNKLPIGFSQLLEKNEKIKKLWLGQGKQKGDFSRTGYDFSLLRECLAHGITDVRALAAILVLRPGGSIKDGHKGEQYIRLTIAKAVRDFYWGKG